MINKVLIFGRYPQNMNVGGPMGFYAQNLQGFSGKYFDTSEYHIHYPKWFLYARKLVGPKLLPIDRLIKRDLKLARIPEKLPFKDWLKETILTFKYSTASDYAFLYFHDLYTYSAVKHLIKPHQKVIFQPHSPEHISKETRYFSDDREVHEWCLKMEQETFSEIEHFVFPHEGAREIYEDLLPENSTSHYILSGCKPKLASAPKEMDKTKINLLFIGRRNAIKGYDIIIKAFEKAYSKNKDLRLYLLGNRNEEEEIEGVIDVGFSTEPENWLAGCDYLLNLNRQSYFDLILMETLSVGTPIILHPNQGHSYFLHNSSSGIKLVPNLEVDSLATSFENLSKPSSENRAENKKMYLETFTDVLYRERVDSFCKEILA